jgi:hypothetical protein
MTKKRSVIFFTRGVNCLGHKAPIIYKTATETSLSVDVVLTRVNETWDRYIIEYLDEINSVTVYQIDNFILQAKGEKTTSSPQERNTRTSNLRRLKESIKRKLSAQFSNYNTQKKINLSLDRIDLYQSPVLVFDKELSDWQRKLVARQDNPVLLFPHGVLAFKNAITDAIPLNQLGVSVMTNGKKEPGTSSGLSEIFRMTEDPNSIYPEYYENLVQHTQMLKKYSNIQFDKFVFSNEHSALRYMTIIDDEKAEILGSPRYCQEWVDILSEIAPRFDWGKAGCLNMVLFLRPFRFFIGTDMLYNTISCLMEFSDVNLVISEHPTASMEYDYEQDLTADEHLNIVKSDVPSTSLLRWGDVFFDVGSSIAYDAIQRGKPVFDLNYLHSNSLIYSEHIPELRIETIDELLYEISKIRNGREFKYGENQKEEFVDASISPTGDVLANYTDLITTTSPAVQN